MALLQDIRHIDLRQRRELYVGIRVDRDALGDVFQRGQQCRELTREGVCADVDVARIAACARPGKASDARGVAVPCAAGCSGRDVVILAVEGQRLVVKLQCQRGHADVVLRGAEAHGQRVVALRAVDAPHQIHQRGVGEVMLDGAVEVELSADGEASAVHHLVALQFRFHIVSADRDGDIVVALGIGHLDLAAA